LTIAAGLRRRPAPFTVDDYVTLVAFTTAWRGGGAPAEAWGALDVQEQRQQHQRSTSVSDADLVWLLALRHALLCGQDDVALQDLTHRTARRADAARVILRSLRRRMLLLLQRMAPAAAAPLAATGAGAGALEQRIAADALMAVQPVLRAWLAGPSPPRAGDGGDSSDDAAGADAPPAHRDATSGGNAAGATRPRFRVTPKGVESSWRLALRAVDLLPPGSGELPVARLCATMFQEFAQRRGGRH
jgi:hypothetical protein